MKFTLSWLKKHLDTTASLEDITRTLTMVGLEVEGVTDPAAKLAPFTVCHVIEAKQHPNADRLRVCQLDTKFGKVQVVCGAPNARTGMKGIFAPDGSFIPGSNITLKAGEIRGEKSNGMLVSEREMGLSDEHNGIIDVTGDYPIGTPLADVLGLNDPVIEIKLTPNRADCAGVRGVARDLVAAGLGTMLRPLSLEPVKGSFTCPITVTLEDTTACPLFIGRAFKGVKNGPSPKWLQDALKAIGLRPISALVDITNFFTFDRARPLHVFDLKKVKGNISVGLAKGGEMLAALNDKVYELQPGMIVIKDEAGVEGLGGVVGGSATGCDEHTTEVFLEAALFDPVRIAKTGRLLGVMTDARYRFERGVDPAAVQGYAEAATRMILEICGGEASELVVAGAAPAHARSYTLRPDRVKTLGGVDVPWSEQQRILIALGFSIKGQEVSPPSWRPDILGEADLVEEILRIKGFDAIPALSLPREQTMTQPAVTPLARKLTAARRAAAGRGLLEAVTLSFIDEKVAKLFAPVDPSLILLNPIAADMNVMRSSPLPGLLTAASRNAARGFGDVAIFEIGPGFAAEGESEILAAIRVGEAVPRQPQGGTRAVDVFDAKADALALLDVLGVPTAGLQVSTDAPAYYHPGRSGTLRLGPTALAQFGEIHPAIRKALDLKGVAVAVEIFPERLPASRSKGTAKPLLALPPFQPVQRDFAFVVGQDVTADKLVKAIKGAEKELVAGIAVFDEYKGKGLAEGKKSLALGVTLQPKDKTLTEAEIEAVSQKIIAAVAKAVGGELRK
jgi:phenylalanyl-tRNA synthetase beta chain